MSVIISIQILLHINTNFIFIQNISLVLNIAKYISMLESNYKFNYMYFLINMLNNY